MNRSHRVGLITEPSPLADRVGEWLDLEYEVTSEPEADLIVGIVPCQRTTEFERSVTRLVRTDRPVVLTGGQSTAPGWVARLGVPSVFPAAPAALRVIVRDTLSNRRL
jgi:hypothetical protein